MAQYYHLNIYKTSFEFLSYYSKLFIHFQREYRYTIGEKLLEKITEFTILIYKANGAKAQSERAKYINEMIDTMQYINITLRLCCELKNISKEKYVHCLEYTQNIEKQLSGWQTYTNNQLTLELEKQEVK